MNDNQTTLYPLPEHPLRAQLADEIRARPYEILETPLRASFLAVLSGEDGYAADHAHITALAAKLGIDGPKKGVNHFSARFSGSGGSIGLRWERHTEFCTYFFHASHDYRHDDPFSNPAINEIPAEWLTQMPGKILVATHVVIEPRDAPERTVDEISEIFSGNTIAGSFMSRRRAKVWTDFRFHHGGYGRHLVRDVSLDGRAAGRMVQRLLEINTYRMMAMLALPEARAARPGIALAESRLASMTERLSAASGVEDERELLKELSSLAAAIENISSRLNFRTASTRAYYKLVQRRVDDIREERIPGLQPPAEFVNRRLIPAMETCFSVYDRTEEVSRRIARASDLLRTRVDVTLEEQNRNLLASMNRRSRMQIRLQQTVEGLSVVAISYYLTGLVIYAAKGAKAYGIGVNPDLVGGMAFPVILVAVWVGIRRVRRAIISTDSGDDNCG